MSEGGVTIGVRMTRAGVIVAELLTENEQLRQQLDDLLEACEKAEQLASVAIDWDLTRVEIDGEMVSVYSLWREFQAAIAKARANG